MATDGAQTVQFQAAPASRKRKSDINLTPPTGKKRMRHSTARVASEDEQSGSRKRLSTRSLRASSRTSQVFQTHPTSESAHASSKPAKDAESTSPSAKSISQTSSESQTRHSPSTAVSTFEADLEADLIFLRLSWGSEPSPEPVPPYPTSKKPDPPQPQRTMVEHDRTRSTSISSNDDSTRSSGRTRKPTTKAKALANEGTMFYKSLRRASDIVDDVDGHRVEEPAQAVNTEPKTASLLQIVAAEPDELVVASVEAASTRTSPRQRKATPKALTSGTERIVRKRKSSPVHVGRASKSARIGSAVPDKPSKLRHPILPTEEEQRDQVTSTDIGVLATIPPGSPAEESVVKGHNVCSLKSCMGEQRRLLAFADFAADDSSDDDDDDLEALLAAAQEIDGPSSKSQKIFESHCVCPPLFSAKKGENQIQAVILTDKADPKPLEAEADETGVDKSASSQNDLQPASEVLLDQDVRRTDSTSLAQELTQPTVADPSSHEQGSSMKVGSTDNLRICLGAHAILNGLTSEQKEYLRLRQSRRDEDEKDNSGFDPDVRNQVQTEHCTVRTHKEFSEDEKNGITAAINAAHAEIQSEHLQKEHERRRLGVMKEAAGEDFVRYQAEMDQKHAAATIAQTQSAATRKSQAGKKAKKRVSNIKKSNAQQDEELTITPYAASKKEPPQLSDLSALSTDASEPSIIAPVQARTAAVEAMAERRESKRKSIPTQRMKILAANSTTVSSKANKRDTTGMRRTRGRQSLSPAPHISVNDARKEEPSMVEQEPRPSKKITLKFRKPQMLV